MSWRAHPLTTVKPPSPLPMSLQAGVVARNLDCSAVAETVPVLVNGDCYSAMWLISGADEYENPYTRRSVVLVEACYIDWSSVK